MARKKGSRNIPADSPTIGGTKHWSIGIDEADNGFIVHASSEGKDGYNSKKMVAPNHRAAMRIASAHLSGLGAKASKAKKGGKKKGTAKMAVSKRA